MTRSLTFLGAVSLMLLACTTSHDDVELGPVPDCSIAQNDDVCARSFDLAPADEAALKSTLASVTLSVNAARTTVGAVRDACVAMAGDLGVTFRETAGDLGAEAGNACHAVATRVASLDANVAVSVTMGACTPLPQPSCVTAGGPALEQCTLPAVTVTSNAPVGSALDATLDAHLPAIFWAEQQLESIAPTLPIAWAPGTLQETAPPSCTANVVTAAGATTSDLQAAASAVSELTAALRVD